MLDEDDLVERLNKETRKAVIVTYCAIGAIIANIIATVLHLIKVFS